MNKRILSIVILASLTSCSTSINSNNKLIIAKDGEGLYLWNGKGRPNLFQNDCFQNKKFTFNPFLKTDSSIRVSVIDKSVEFSNSNIFNWTDYNIDFKNNSCNFLISHKYSRVFTQAKAKYTSKIFSNNDTLATQFDTILPMKFISTDKGWALDNIISGKPNIMALDKSLNGNVVYLQYANVYIKNGKSESVIYNYKGYSDDESGNGIFDLDISDDGQIIIIPILKTSMFQWITNTGKGEVLLYDVKQHKVIKTINERMLRPKISPDKKQIAYFNSSNRIMVYDIVSGHSEKIFEGNDFEWIE